MGNGASILLLPTSVYVSLQNVDAGYALCPDVSLHSLQHASAHAACVPLHACPVQCYMPPGVSDAKCVFNQIC